MTEPKPEVTFADAVQSYLAENGLVVKWVLVADVLAPEGQRYLVTDASPDTPPWELAGMLDHIREGMQAAHTAAVMSEQGESGEAV